MKGSSEPASDILEPSRISGKILAQPWLLVTLAVLKLRKRGIWFEETRYMVWRNQLARRGRIGITIIAVLALLLFLQTWRY